MIAIFWGEPAWIVRDASETSKQQRSPREFRGFHGCEVWAPVVQWSHVMVTRLLALAPFLVLVACSGEKNGALENGDDTGSFVKQEGDSTTPAPASSPSTKASTTAPSASTKPDAGAPPKTDTPAKDTCAELTKCCDTITRPVAKLACTAAAGSGQEQICEPALAACEGDGGT